jgi:hypothetical protein
MRLEHAGAQALGRYRLAEQPSAGVEQQKSDFLLRESLAGRARLCGDPPLGPHPEAPDKPPEAYRLFVVENLTQVFYRAFFQSPFCLKVCDREILGEHR